mgnify:CR=1 FL=1
MSEFSGEVTLWLGHDVIEIIFLIDKMKNVRLVYHTENSLVILKNVYCKHHYLVDLTKL